MCYVSQLCFKKPFKLINKNNSYIWFNFKSITHVHEAIKTGVHQLVLVKINCLLLFASTYMCFAYVKSADNPADAPSRWRHVGV